ncbi:MAG: hypothetical protein PGN34_13935 [Methylobacterium frigidaeris]
MTAGSRTAHRVGLLVAAVILSSGAGAQTPPADEGNPFMNILRYGGTTKPPEAPPTVDEVYCPVPEIAEGGASIQSQGGGGLRSQISIAQVSRSCAPGPGGTTVVRVGVQGRALLGPGGSPGRFDAPVTIAIKRGTEIVTRRTQRAVASIPAGQASGAFTVVEEGLSVPAPYANEFGIEVGLGGAAKPARAPRRKPAATEQPG